MLTMFLFSLERVGKGGKKQQSDNFHNLQSLITSMYLHPHPHPLPDLLLLWINWPLFLFKINFLSSINSTSLLHFFLSTGSLHSAYLSIQHTKHTVIIFFKALKIFFGLPYAAQLLNSSLKENSKGLSILAIFNSIPLPSFHDYYQPLSPFPPMVSTQLVVLLDISWFTCTLWKTLRAFHLTVKIESPGRLGCSVS